VLAVPEPFDPATSDRVFRVACPISGRVLSEVMGKVRAEAPGVKLEWTSAPRQVYDAVAEGLVDIAHLGGETRLPDGLDSVEVAPFVWTSFLRDGQRQQSERRLLRDPGNRAENSTPCTTTLTVSLTSPSVSVSRPEADSASFPSTGLPCWCRRRRSRRSRPTGQAPRSFR